MDWTWLLLLLCPLMMIFMMKGMHGTHGKHEHQTEKEILELKTQLSQYEMGKQALM